MKFMIRDRGSDFTAALSCLAESGLGLKTGDLE
jgi:hypothetical protein